MSLDIHATSASPTMVDVLTDLKSRHYALPRYAGLEAAFDGVVAHFISSHQAGLHHEGRGLIVVGGTRAGKSHDIKQLLRAFSSNPVPLAGGYERRYIRRSLRATATWKHLGSACLKALAFPSDLDHRSVDMVWRRAEAQLQRQRCMVLHIDECQHLFVGKSEKDVAIILNGLKDLMKRPNWPILPILSGVPDLLEDINANEQLTALLEPITYPDVRFDADSLKEVDTILVLFASSIGLDPSDIRDEDVYNRMIHGSGYRWGRLMELVIHTLASVAVTDRKKLKTQDLAETFRRWTGVPDAANVFLIESPYRIETRKLYRA
jgi:hypothetical protein